MAQIIENGFMAFVAEGSEGIGAVREVTAQGLVIYVENAGEFFVLASAIKSVHDQKVMLNSRMLDESFLKAIGHVHDREDPTLTG
jgi:hypothetical protein